MDSSRNKTPCRNSTYGCTFATSSMVDMVRHFQCDCTFHPVRCFKCNKTVRKVNFAKHYAQFCQDSSAPPCPAPEEAPDVGDAKANTTMSQELHFLQECVRECTLGVESLSHVLSDVAAEVKVTKEKQQDLEAIVKGQSDVIQERSNSISMVVEKVNKVQEDVSGLVNRLEKDVATIVQRVENVDGLVKEVRALTGPLADQSKIHWYVENVSHYIKKANIEESLVQSNLFVIRGYSAKLLFKVQKWETRQYMGLYLLLCRGARDSVLQWPFRITYTLSLIHPNDASKTEKVKITPPDYFPERFEKPKNEENEGCGTPVLCTVEEAQDEGFIENDAVCFALTLHE